MIDAYKLEDELSEAVIPDGQYLRRSSLLTDPPNSGEADWIGDWKNTDVNKPQHIPDTQIFWHPSRGSLYGGMIPRELYAPQFGEPHYCDFSSGAALLIDKKLIEKISREEILHALAFIRSEGPRLAENGFFIISAQSFMDYKRRVKFEIRFHQVYAEDFFDFNGEPLKYIAENFEVVEKNPALIGSIPEVDDGESNTEQAEVGFQDEPDTEVLIIESI